MVDAFSKYALAYPLRDKSAEGVAKILTDQVFTVYGTQFQLLSDLGREFDNQILSELCRLMGIHRIKTTSYKPLTNGVAERFHRTLNNALAKVVSENQKDWCERLPSIVAAYRATKHASTGFSPNFLMFGREVRTPVGLILDPEEASVQSVNEYAKRLLERQHQSFEVVRRQLGAAAERNRRSYDRRVNEQEFKPGQQVYYYCPRRHAGRSAKWTRFYSGPYTVQRVLGPVNYAIRRSPRSKVFVAHVDKLKAYYEPTLDQNGPAANSQVADDEVDTEADRPAESTRPRREHQLPKRYRQ